MAIATLVAGARIAAASATVEAHITETQKVATEITCTRLEVATAARALCHVIAEPTGAITTPTNGATATVAAVGIECDRVARTASVATRDRALVIGIETGTA